MDVILYNEKVMIKKIILLCLMVVLGLFLYKHIQNKEDTRNADLATYRNDTYGFSLTYNRDTVPFIKEVSIIEDYVEIGDFDEGPGHMNITIISKGFDKEIYSGLFGECMSCLLINFLKDPNMVKRNPSDYQEKIANNGVFVIEPNGVEDTYNYVFPLQSKKYAAIGFNLRMSEQERNALIDSLEIYPASE